MQTSAAELIRTGVQLSAGVLSADLLRLGEELDHLDQAGTHLLHVDVMDGEFSPMMTAGPPLVRALPERFVRDVHLMINRPEAKLEQYVEAGADILTFHVEATRHPLRALQSLGGTGIVRGVALNPDTPLQAVYPLLGETELLLVLAVKPGFPGQAFVTSTEAKLAELGKHVASESDRPAIGVDGGVTLQNAAWIAGLGVDLVIAGSSVFRDGQTATNARAMRDALTSASRASTARLT